MFASPVWRFKKIRIRVSLVMRWVQAQLKSNILWEALLRRDFPLLESAAFALTSSQNSAGTGAGQDKDMKVHYAKL
jgi:hypothetical protein